MIDKDGKVYRGLQAQVAYLTEKVENGGGGSTPTGPTVDKITALDLAAGEAALTYDANNGATVVKQGRISADGNTFDVTVEDKLPIVPGDNVTIGATADGKHLKISATGGGGGSGVAGVSSFGGKTGAINVGKNLSMNGNVVNADFQPTPVIIETLNNEDASTGTLTDNQLATLQANTANPIVKRNEYYYLNDNQHTSGTLGYTHLGYENGKWYAKSITITISSKAWVKKSSDIPNKTMIPFVSLSGSANTYPIRGNFTSEDATKLISSPFSVISFTPPGSAIQVPLLLQPSETIHNSYVYSGHDDSYIYTINATLSSTSAGTWLAKSYVITRAAYVTPVITTIDGVSGAFTLGDNLNLENKVISATDTVTTVNGHTGAVNIVAGSNVSVNDVGGTLTISATGGGGGAECEIGLTDLAVLDLGEFKTFPVNSQTLTDEQAELIEQHKFSFIKFTDKNGWNNALDLDVYCVPVDNAPGHGGITYKSITTQGNTYTVGITVEKTSGNIWGLKRYGITKEATPTSGGGGGGCYLHHLVFFNDPGTNAQIEFYSSQSTPFTFDSFKTKLGSKLLYPTGTLSSNGQTYPIGQCSFDSSSGAFNIGGIGANSAVEFTSFSSSEVIEL